MDKWTGTIEQAKEYLEDKIQEDIFAALVDPNYKPDYLSFLKSVQESMRRVIEADPEGVARAAAAADMAVDYGIACPLIWPNLYK